MKVLVGCEFSGTVRDAFLRAGHEARSCDVLRSVTGPEWHIQDTVLNILDEGWDLAIFHPPCTYLTAAAEWAYSEAPMINGKPRRISEGTLIGKARTQARQEAAEFVRQLWEAPIKKICIENPVGAINRMLPEMPKPQYVHPYWFGEDRSKKTGLWLKGLPQLVATEMVAGSGIEYPVGSGKWVERWGNQSPCGADSTPPGEDRWKIRSMTSPGLAEAMAEQWGDL